MERQRDRPIERRRLSLLLAGSAGLFLVFLLRFFYVQVIHNGHYAQVSARQSVRRVNLHPERGEITDRAGRGLAVNALSGRLYPFGERAGQVIGFVGRDGYGLAGVEYGFDRALFGEAGWTLMRQDARRHRFFEADAPSKRPENGVGVELALDIRVQEILEESLKEGVEATGALSGTAVALDPATGDILGMANVPSLDPNLPASRRERRDGSNRAVSMVYEPGSTFKLVAAAAALESGTFREEDVLKTGDGKLKIYDQFIHDTHSYGDLTFVQAMAVSSNIAFAKVGMALGPERLYRFVRNFGFGQKTGIELPGEEAGLFKPVEKWSGRTLATVAMGHEISVTPLQLASAYAAVANGGILLCPRIVRRLVSGGKTVREFPVVPVRRVVTEQTARRLIQCFRSVVDLPEGTGKLARIEGLDVAGKTGTAEKVDPETGLYLKDRFHASFVGFFPADRPLFLCFVVLNEPRKVHTGGLAAAPVFRKIAVRLLHCPDLAFGARCAAPVPAAPQELVSALPLLEGLPADSALALCRSLGISARLLGSGGRIAGQSPAAEHPLKAGEFLKLSMESLPDSTVEMPRLVGWPLRQAAGFLNHLGLEVVVEGRGTVLRQFPAAGEKLKARPALCRLIAG